MLFPPKIRLWAGFSAPRQRLAQINKDLASARNQLADARTDGDVDSAVRHLDTIERLLRQKEELTN